MIQVPIVQERVVSGQEQKRVTWLNRLTDPQTPVFALRSRNDRALMWQMTIEYPNLVAYRYLGPRVLLR